MPSIHLMSTSATRMPMRHFPLLAATLMLLLSFPSSAGVARPSYWEGDGLVEWTIPGDMTHNHGGALEAQQECYGTLRIQSYGPVLRDGATLDGAGIATVTYGEGGRYVYPTRIEVIPHPGSCEALEFRLDAAHQGLDVFDERFDCTELGCSTLTLSWSERAGTLAIRVPRADLFPQAFDATIGATFVLPAP